MIDYNCIALLNNYSNPSTLVDKHGRAIKSMRISLTDRCNLRCSYCIQEEDVEWVELSKILSFEEINRLVGILYNLGVKKLRLTGGEPTIRHDNGNDIVDLVSLLKSNYPDLDIALTTNGVLLEKYSQPLKDAGLNRINISLDSLDKDKMEFITNRKYYDKIMAGVDTAIETGFDVIKINAVAMKNFNTDEESLRKFVNFIKKTGLELRFIEQMPFNGIDLDTWKDKNYISSKDIRKKLHKLDEFEEDPLDDESQTSRMWSIKGGKGKIGFISSVSESFCSFCDRIRFTAEGNFRPCLHCNKEYPLLDLLRNHGSDEDIIKILKKGLNEKWDQHPDFLALQYLPPFDDREMIRIGG